MSTIYTYFYYGLLDSQAKINLTPAESVSFMCIAPALRETCVYCKNIAKFPFWVVKFTIIIIIVCGRVVYIEVGPYVNEIETCCDKIAWITN